MNNNRELSQVLYETQEEFFAECVNYRNINNPNTRSNQIKTYIHEILTKAIFTFHPCKDLLVFYKSNPPTPEKWIIDECKWLAVTAEPIQHVSDQFLKLYFSYLHLIQNSIFRSWIQFQTWKDPTIHFLQEFIKTSRERLYGTVLKYMQFMHGFTYWEWAKKE